MFLFSQIVCPWNQNSSKIIHITFRHLASNILMKLLTHDRNKLEASSPQSKLSSRRNSMKLGNNGLYYPGYPYLAPLGLRQLLRLPLVELLHHLRLHDLLCLRDPPQHLSLNLLPPPLELLLDSFGDKFLDPFICLFLDTSELIIFNPPVNLNEFNKTIMSALLFTFVSQFLQAFQPLTSLFFCSTFWRNGLSLSR